MFKKLDSLARTAATWHLIHLVIQFVVICNAALWAAYFFGWQTPFQLIYGDSLWSCVGVCAFLVFVPGRLCLRQMKRLVNTTASLTNFIEVDPYERPNKPIEEFTSAERLAWLANHAATADERQKRSESIKRTAAICLGAALLFPILAFLVVFAFGKL
jgi:hypothetical protein